MAKLYTKASINKYIKIEPEAYLRKAGEWSKVTILGEQWSF